MAKFGLSVMIAHQVGNSLTTIGGGIQLMAEIKANGLAGNVG